MHIRFTSLIITLIADAVNIDSNQTRELVITTDFSQHTNIHTSHLIISVP